VNLAGLATGIGSLPGDDPREAAALTLEALPDLPHVPELPERGPWAQLPGRAAAILVDLPVEWDGNAWRTAFRPGRDVNRARAMLAEDLDAVEDRFQGYHGPAKLQMSGPLTLAAVVELRGGTAAVSDRSATNDLAASLVEGLREHLRDLQRRVPGADWVVQVDEPALSAVTAGSVPRASGWGTIAAVEAAEAGRLLRSVTSQLGADVQGVVVHSCATEPDWAALTQGVDPDRGALSVDLEVIDLQAAAPAMEAWVGAGGSLWFGVNPLAVGAEGESTALERLEVARSVLGIAPEHATSHIALTPSCGISGSADVARASYAGVQRLMRRLRGDDPSRRSGGA